MQTPDLLNHPRLLVRNLSCDAGLRGLTIIDRTGPTLLLYPFDMETAGTLFVDSTVAVVKRSQPGEPAPEGWPSDDVDLIIYNGMN